MIGVSYWRCGLAGNIASLSSCVSRIVPCVRLLVVSRSRGGLNEIKRLQPAAAGAIMSRCG